MTSRKCDIVVIGAGFAGSLSATLLRTLGWDVLLVERGRHPRFAIGESSTPLADAALRRICARYGLAELAPLATYGLWKARYPAIRCGLKRGFTYFWHDLGKEHRPTPDHRHEFAVAASQDDGSSDTHWLRADVDSFFCDVAKQRGVEYWDQCVLNVVDHSRDQWTFRAATPDRQTEVTAQFVVDASGTEGVIAKALGIEDATDMMATHSSAILGHFENLPRWRGMLAERGAALGDYPFDPDAAAVHQVHHGGWMWQLRFDHEVVSAGFAYSPAAAIPPSGLSAEAEFAWRCRQCPSLAEQFSKARCIAPQPTPVRSGRMQRLWSRAAGPNWAMLPFTAGFIDPLHSTGIAHSLSTIERLVERFETRGVLPDLLSMCRYSDALIGELRLIDRMVAACYAGMVNFRLFTATSMLYFAAATFAETTELKDMPRDFLGAEEAGFQAIVAESLDRLRSMGQSEVSPSDVAGFESWMKSSLAPYNRVGLFSPAKPNMYAYTATKPPLRSADI